MSPTVYEIIWDRVALAPRGHAVYAARLLLRGDEVWRCLHVHVSREGAKACGFGAWQRVRDLVGDQTARAA
jgi:hypothetical protein